MAAAYDAIAIESGLRGQTAAMLFPHRWSRLLILECN